LEWLCHRTSEYHSNQDDINDLVEGSEQEGKLGQGFSSLDSLEEVDRGDGSVHQPTYVSARLPMEQKDMLCCLVKEFSYCFMWSYTEMLGLKRELVEHKLSIKRRFRPYKQPVRNYNLVLYDRIKEKVE
jgi:hypothetical protein